MTNHLKISQGAWKRRLLRGGVSIETRPSLFVSVSESTLSHTESQDVIFTTQVLLYYNEIKRKVQKNRKREEATRLQMIESKRSEVVTVTTSCQELFDI